MCVCVHCTMIRVKVIGSIVEIDAILELNGTFLTPT